ncbi:MAG: transcription-repair coupling factor, partial [Oscillospiraceae bacterium]|nr:transcription-repair coupling factor [Oscillospiraceae bacterium]
MPAIFSYELENITRALDAGASPVLASGIGAASRAHVAASLRRHTGSPLFVICPDDQSADIFRRDLSSLLNEEVSLLSQREFTFYPAEEVTRETEQRRLAVLDRLACEKSAVTVCTVAALLQRAIPPEAMRECSMELSASGTYPIEEIEKTLLRCGYVHRVQVEGAGQFSRRGGILDFFSPAYPNPIRIEFWGDDVDSMGFFDITTQRRIENIDSCRIIPACETLPSLYEGGESALADELTQYALKNERRAAKAASATLAQNLRRDAEKLREAKNLSDADRYMGLIYPEFSCALDYIPLDALVFLSEPVKTAKLSEDQQKLMNEDVRLLIEGGSLLGSFATYRMTYTECAERLVDFPLVMGDSFTQGRTLPEPRSVVGITAKQLPSYGGNMETALDDVRHYIKSGFSVLVLASDDRRAGLMRDHFINHDIFATVSALDS